MKTQQSTANFEALQEQFSTYLKQQRYRNTQERFVVLEKAIQVDKHFNADELYLLLRADGIRVSRATVYSTLDLLTKCNILVKHHFQGESAHFELTERLPNHDHLICTECGYIVEFQEEALNAIEERICKEYDFRPIRSSLQIFAVCKDPRTCEHKNHVLGN